MYLTKLIEEEFVPEVSNLAWSTDRASVGDQIELTADVSGDAGGLVFRVTNARGQAIATLTPVVSEEGKARASWRVPPFGDRGEQYDFAAWSADQRLGASDRLFVGAPGAASDPVWRGLGAKRPRGLAWPPRSLAGGDTILLPVTVAVSWLGLSPWSRHAWPGPGVCHRSACRGRGPAPP